MEITRRDRLADADARLSVHLAEAARRWWGIGAVCLEVAREELYAEDGFADVWAWAQERHGISRRTAGRAMEVARHFSAEMAERYGSAKLASTVAYLETTHRVEEAGEATSLKFRVMREGRFASIPFEQATSRDIDEARALVVRSRQEAPPAPEPTALEKAKALNAALATLPKATGRGERVTVTRAPDGSDRLTFREIPADGLEAFARAVLASLGG